MFGPNEDEDKDVNNVRDGEWGCRAVGEDDVRLGA